MVAFMIDLHFVACERIEDVLEVHPLPNAGEQSK
jgi:hypothetical protein